MCSDNFYHLVKYLVTKQTFSSVNLTTSVANVNPALTSHVNNIKICFLKIERMLIYTTYVADASEIYSVRSLQKVCLE